MSHAPWVDIHCHIYPGVDDGSRNLEESIAMAGVAEDGGTSLIAASFHAGVDLVDAKMYLPLIAGLNESLHAKGIGVRVVPGAELLAGFLPDNLADFAIHGSRYLLVEFPASHLPRTASAMLMAYRERGFHPIIAHPERNMTILREPGRLFELVEETGSLVQLTADSIAGNFSREITLCSRYLLKKKAVDIIASDAHGLGHRTPSMADGVKAAAKIVGTAAALKMVHDHPLAVVENVVWDKRDTHREGAVLS